MKCRGCSQDKKLVKSHIIPESFFKGLRGEKETAKILANRKDFHPKKSPIGVYDPEILCKDCEAVFQKYDDYGHNLLIKNEASLEKLIHHGRLVGYRADNIDYNLLKLFFISVLWRASISSHYFYKGVYLGKLEDYAKQLIWDNNPGGKHDFSFVLGKFDGDEADRTILNPHTERWFNIRYYRFYLYGYVLYIKSDSQKTPAEWEKFIPNNGSIIIVSRGFMESSKEYPLLVAAAKMHAKT